MWQHYFFIFNNITCFFYKKYFYKQHQAEIYSEIITVSSNKRSQNKIKTKINKDKNKTY